nr:MAG TPA: hypothetical protein [Caudoviricetes sp.]
MLFFPPVFSIMTYSFRFGCFSMNAFIFLLFKKSNTIFSITISPPLTEYCF